VLGLPGLGPENRVLSGAAKRSFTEYNGATFPGAAPSGQGARRRSGAPACGSKRGGTWHQPMGGGC
jgi:hypothetical protein